MPCIVFDKAEIDMLLAADIPAPIRDKLTAATAAPDEREAKIIEIAGDMAYVREGEVEIDDPCHGMPIISEGGDNGAYVLAWVWADFAGTELDKTCAECGEPRGDDEDPDGLCDGCRGKDEAAA